MTGQYASYANSVQPCKLVCQNNDSEFVHENRFARLLDEVETDVYTALLPIIAGYQLPPDKIQIDIA